MKRLILITLSFLGVLNCSQRSQQEATTSHANDLISQKLADEMIRKAHQGTLTEDKLQEYLKQGVDINAIDSLGTTALMNAAMGKQLPVVKLLVKNGALMNLKNRLGESALMYARENLELVQFLINNGADINIRDENGKTVLIRIISSLTSFRHNIPTIKFLLQHNADINVQDTWGWTALMYAADNSLHEHKVIFRGDNVSSENLVTLLLNAGANPHLRSYDENTVAKNIHATFPHLSEDDIQKKMAHASQSKFYNRTFLGINPALATDPAIQKAIESYGKRQVKQKQIVGNYLLPDLADVVEAYSGVQLSSEGQ